MKENEMKSIKDLSTLELKALYQRGWISRIDIREIAELRHFYNELEEELKRRRLKMPEGYEVTGRYFTLDHHSCKFVFKVISWVPVSPGILSDIANEHHLTGFINATDCADYLVKKGLPFRDAYKATGTLVAICIEKGLTLETLPLEEYQSVCDTFDEGVYEAISLEKCVSERNAYGGPANVLNAIKEVRELLK